MMTNNRFNLWIILLLTAGLIASGCAEEISPSNSEATTGGSGSSGATDGGTATDGTTDGGNTNGSGLIVNSKDADGITTTNVDASSNDIWVYMDLETGNEVTPKSPEDDGSWDLAFQRFKIKTNGGISGTGKMEVARVSGQTFAELTEAPAEGYIQDAEDTDGDEDVDPDYAFNGPTPWFDYNPVEHTLKPADVVYVAKSVDGKYYKISFLNYYDDAGNGGYPQIKWGEVAAPSGKTPPPPKTNPDEMIVDASTNGEWTYITLKKKTVVKVDDPSNSEEWDLGISRTQLATNSGSSGSAHGGAVATADQWDAVKTISPVGFIVDESVPLPGPPGSGEFSGHPVLNTWYDYDGATHTVTPKDTVYVVRTAAGAYVKLQFLKYESGVHTLRLETIERETIVTTTALESSNAEQYVYFNFDSGQVVTPEKPEESHAWDIAVSRTKIQTNSGTSGKGQGGALDPAKNKLADLGYVEGGSGCYLMAEGHVCKCEMTQKECEEKKPQPGAWTPQCACEIPFVVDEMLPLPGPPGSGEFSGNPVLGAWYDYDDITHVTTPKEAVFLVRTAHGHYTKVQITKYDDGNLTMDWVYAGPGENTF